MCRNSEAAVRSGLEGAPGADASIVTDNAEDAMLVLPAVSVAFAVMTCAPFDRTDVAMLQLPLPSANPVPTRVVPLYSRTVAPASAVPVKVGVVTLVMLSVLDIPLSDAAIRSGADGATGACVSIVTDRITRRRHSGFRPHRLR